MSDKFSFRLLFLFSFAVCGLFPLNLAASEPTEDFTGIVAPQLTSYSEIDLSKTTFVATSASGSSPITHFKVANTGGAVYRETYNTWALDKVNGTGLSFTLGLSHPTMVQLGLRTAAALVNKKSNNPIQITVNGSDLFSGAHTDTNDQWHQIYWNIPQALLKKGANTIDVKLAASATTQYFVQQATVTPQKIYAQEGILNTSIFAQFGETTTITGANNADGTSGTAPTSSQIIWTRGYGLTNDMMMIPAPTLYFAPGDYVSVDLRNLLNRNTLASLDSFENAESSNLSNSPDETLDNVNDKLRHEVNIPHNLDNTNLHVHGLHVDPSKDDVTIVIVPEGESTEGYDAPHSPVPTGEGLNEGSVADQSIKAGSWDYQYRIPSLHLPGTHWYHPHKHGSTAAQLENGMAGSIVIQENSGNAVVPYPGTTGTVVGGAKQTDYHRMSWEDNHDRVLMIQEIANYGTQKGGADGGGQNSKSPDITINGEHQPTLTLASGQLERWRFVNAGANHRAFNHMWIGKDTGEKDANNNPIYTSADADIYLVAVDGITLSKKIKISAQNPLLLAPGNRADLLVQITEPGTYSLFKYYPTNISIKDASGNYIWNCSSSPCTGTLSAAQAPNSNPYLFAQTGVGAADGASENFAGFTQTWDGTSISVVPLLKVSENNNFLDIDFALAADFTVAGGKGKWQPSLTGFGGGQVEPALLMNIIIKGAPVGTSPNMPTDTYLSSIHLVNNLGNTPAYVSQVSDNDVLQSRPVIFDLSGAEIKVTDPEKSTNTVKVKQFTLNGRLFALNDPIGNSTTAVNARLQHGVTNSTLNQVDTVSTDGINSDPVTMAIEETLTFSDVNTSAWTNSVASQSNGTSWLMSWLWPWYEPGPVIPAEKTYYWANPGYFQSLVNDASGNGVQYDNTNLTPTWYDISGISTPAIVNTTNAKHAEIEGIPGLPVATTAEEWILINNSDVGHPFHIHINPFFVTEVGQLSYEQFSGGKKEWIIRATSTKNLPTITSSDPAPTTPTAYDGDSLIPSFVGNWWDTAIVPPHGYVKLRYWFNVPNQTGEGSAATVVDDFNKQGIWVFHCHILRHEDRGMMMPVITQEKVCTKQ